MGYNNKKSTIILPIVVSVIAIAAFIGGRYSTAVTNDQVINVSDLNMMRSAMSTSKMGYILRLIESKYVDSINVDTLSEEYIEKMLHKLDPHSAYIPASEAISSNEHLEGEFDGIGVMFNMATDTVIIQTVISGGPAEAVGVLPGDRIIMIGDSVVAGRDINQNDIVKRLKGKGGTVVKIDVERSGNSEYIPFEIVRGKIPIKSIDAAFMVAPEVGYIKLLQFSRTTHTEFIKAVEQLKSEGMKKLIFDMTSNSGGYLDQAILIANEFLPSGKMIVYTEGRKSRYAEQYSDGNGRFQNQDLVVLIDENSASSSEIVAGALQDNDRGVLMGRRSFGKGLVQQQIPLNDGSLVNLTIAHYHTPTGRSIQRPYDQGYEQYYRDFFNRYVDSELLNRDSVKLNDSLRYQTPNGKIVYGGGGIMPDIFIPLDTTLVTDKIRDLFSNNTLFLYTLRYTDSNRKDLVEIKDIETLKSYFDKNRNQIFSEFSKFAASKGTRLSLNAIEKETVLNYIFAYISRNSGVSDNGFYLYFNNLDNIFKTALDMCQNPEKYEEQLQIVKIEE